MSASPTSFQAPFSSPPATPGENTPLPGIFFVISAPSGAGKTSLITSLIAQDPGISASLSMTTRPPRSGEVHGIDYLFTDAHTFHQQVDQGVMLEYAHVFEHSYGTPRKPLEERIRSGQDVIADLDWQGALQVQRRYTGGPIITIFIAPPSLQALQTRLQGRGQDDPHIIQRRLASAKAELGQSHHYDHILINNDFDTALADLRQLIAQVRYHHQRRHAHLTLIQDLIDQEDFPLVASPA